MQLATGALRFFADNFQIHSAALFVFLAPVALVYFTLARRLALQWALLLCVSVVFCGVNGGAAALLLLAPVAVTYAGALWHAAARSRGARTAARLLAAAVVVFDVAFLVCFKELNFFVRLYDAVAARAGLPLLGDVRLPSPLGLSYISLMLVGYFLDCAWGICPVQKNPLKFCAWAVFFPLVTSGPIARYSGLCGSLFSRRRFDYESFCAGAQRILWGFLKKLVVADRLALLVSVSYDSPGLSGLPVLLGLFLFALQLYFDFSACMDIVLGLGWCFGIRLPENFMQPFFSESLTEMWRRWHATLGSWARDYILYPMLKSRAVQSLSRSLGARLGKRNFWARNVPTWCGTFVVWFCMGFWHGGSWNCIFGSGLFFFALITAGHIAAHALERSPAAALVAGGRDDGWAWARRLRTSLLFAACVSFVRAPSLGAGFCLWRRALSPMRVPFFRAFGGSGFSGGDFWVLLLFVSLVFFVERVQAKAADESAFRTLLSGRSVAVRWAFFLLLVVSVAVFGMYGPAFDARGFIYGGF